MTVLVAEDDPFFRQLLQKLLAAEHEIITAENGLRAWEIIQQSALPLLVILDWVMPGLTGPQVCRNVRSHPKAAGTYLILLTARNSAADIVAGMRAGADDYMTKPFEPEELRVRARVGQRIMQLQQELGSAHAELDRALLREQTLKGQLATLMANSETPSLANGASA